ncbi:hypothetical protein [Mesorhizobium sp.]|uniref:hypothetical protein n=1 Tax=Mesorhizobium sp. TaxID=1871066 RepID=UPI000FE3D77B|nr:hypothetical protein [Mesorhizobium sp.]RWJ03400.1 MAG: hypothetical protein EOR24_31975 [Mesorhizobium sp.]
MSDDKKFKVRNYIDSAQLKADSAINKLDLSSAMLDQASRLVEYGELHAKAARQVDDVEIILENTIAAVARRLRDEAASSGEKVTETKLDQAVTRHPKVIAAKKALNEAKQIEAVAKIAVEAFKHRRDMLVQLGAYERKEMEGEIAVRVRESREQRAESDKDAVLAIRRAAIASQQ